MSWDTHSTHPAGGEREVMTPSCRSGTAYILRGDATAAYRHGPPGTLGWNGSRVFPGLHITEASNTDLMLPLDTLFAIVLSSPLTCPTPGPHHVAQGPVSDRLMPPTPGKSFKGGSARGEDNHRRRRESLSSGNTLASRQSWDSMADPKVFLKHPYDPQGGGIRALTRHHEQMLRPLRQ